MLRSYALAPKTIDRLMGRTFWRYQSMMTVSFLMFGLYLAFFAGPLRWERAGPLLGFIALVYFFVIFFNYRVLLRNLYALRYEIDGSNLIFRQRGADPQRVSRADIRAVQWRADGLLLEMENGQVLQIPAGLARDGDNDFRQTLSAWLDEVPVETRVSGQAKRLMWAGSLGVVLALLFANRLEIILPVLLLAVALGMYIERRLTADGSAGPGVARMYNMAFSFIILVLVMKSCAIAMSLAWTG